MSVRLLEKQSILLQESYIKGLFIFLSFPFQLCFFYLKNGTKEVFDSKTDKLLKRGQNSAMETTIYKRKKRSW